MNELLKSLSVFLSLIEWHEPTFDTRDDIFLNQFGIRRLTEWRHSHIALKQTELDRLMAGKGLLGALNDTVTMDCVCEYKGIQFYIFERYGQWGFGKTIYVPGTGLREYYPDCQRYTVWPDNESRHGTYRSFPDAVTASNWASRFVHQFDGEDFRVILHVEDNKIPETIDTVENIRA